MYLNKWDLSFDLEKDIPSAVPLWVNLSHLPLHCWNDETLQEIGNSLDNYIDKAESKGPFSSYARICVEVYLEKVLPEAIKLYMDRWEHMQKVDYEYLPFKCKKCHEYGHFVKKFPKVVQETLGKKSRGRMEANKKGMENTSIIK